LTTPLNSNQSIVPVTSPLLAANAIQTFDYILKAFSTQIHHHVPSIIILVRLARPHSKIYWSPPCHNKCTSV